MTSRNMAWGLCLVLAACGELGASPSSDPTASVQAALHGAVKRSSARGGFTLVADAKTGRVVAQASEGPDGLPQQIDPASLLKPLVAAVAIETGATALDTLHDCAGAAAGFDTAERLTTAETLVKSSNRCARQIVADLPHTVLSDRLEQLGVRPSATGPAEGDDWLNGSGGCMAPSDLLKAYAAIANGGGELGGMPLSASTAEGLKAALRRAVTDGTGQRARSAKLTTAGKTGTSMGTNPRCATGQKVALFAGFAPVESPRWVVLTAVIEPDDTAPLGGRYAAPLFREIVETLPN